MTNSTIFYQPLCPATGTSWCSWIISALNSLSFGIYIFSSFNTNSPSIYYLFTCNSFTLTFFIPSTILTIFLFLLLAFFIFSIISTFGPSIITSYMLQIQLSLINTWFSSSLSTLSFQSDHLLSLSTFLIFVPGICFNIKSNLDKYKAYQACLWFNFCAFIKYSKFLWSV